MKVILVDAVNTLIMENAGNFKTFEEIQEILDSFPNRKIIFTGANDEQFKRFGLDKMPYEVFTLKHKPEKAERSYYEIMLRRFNLRREDVVYIEHNSEAVRSASSVGIKTYHFDAKIKDLEALREFLEENIKS